MIQFYFLVLKKLYTGLYEIIEFNILIIGFDVDQIKSSCTNKICDLIVLLIPNKWQKHANINMPLNLQPTGSVFHKCGFIEGEEVNV